MGCLKLTYQNFESPLKVVYKKSSFEQNNVQRFLSIDPRFRDFAGMSPYAFAANSPIMAIDEDGEGPRIVIYSTYNTRRVKAALKKGNYKKINRILKHSSTHGWVNSKGKINTYEARKMRANGVNAPLNKSTTVVDSKTDFSLIIGYEKDNDGNYNATPLFIAKDKGTNPTVSDLEKYAEEVREEYGGSPEYTDEDEPTINPDDDNAAWSQIFGGAIGTFTYGKYGVDKDGKVTYEDLNYGDTFRVSTTTNGSPPYITTQYKDTVGGGKMKHAYIPENKKAEDYVKIKQ